jgi:hypothetical protein
LRRKRICREKEPAQFERCTRYGAGCIADFDVKEPVIANAPWRGIPLGCQILYFHIIMDMQDFAKDP